MPTQTDLFTRQMVTEALQSSSGLIKNTERDATNSPVAGIPVAVRHHIRIEFDGGTPCNIPRIGYGLGYGSYQIDSGGTRAPIVRVQFDVPMSANVAEISTLIRALKGVIKCYNPENTSLEIHGDSKIALSRCTVPLKPNKHYDSAFAAACHELQELCSRFAQVQTHWRGRAASVKLFGH